MRFKGEMWSSFVVFSLFWISICGQYLPKITYLHVVSEIDYRFSKTIVTSKMVNQKPFATEAKFDIDLPNEAFITAFKLTVNGRDYHGDVKEREIARRQFEAAKARGETAGHIISRPRNTNSFQVQVNVEALGEVKFELVYRELLKRTKGYYNHIIYLNPGQLVEDFLITVMITESRTVTYVKIPPLQKGLLAEGPLGDNELAQVEFLSKTQVLVTYQPTLQQQAALSDGGVSGQFIVQYDVERFNDAGEILVMDGWIVHYFAPEGLPPIPMDIILVFDKSGSMLGRKMSQLQAALIKILDDTKDIDRIMLLSFSHTVHSWNRGLVAADRNNKEAAKQYIREQMAFGGTNINLGITEGLRELKTYNHGDRPALMIFLTDGKATAGVTDTDRILQNIINANTYNIPIFALAFGREADYTISKKIAAKNFGFARKIFEDADATLQITGFYDEISSLLLEDVNFKYLDGALYDSTVTDRRFNNYFKGSELVVAGKSDDINRLQQGMKISATGYGHRNISINYPPNQCTILPYKDQGLPPGERHPGMMEKLWAYLTIKQLLKKMDATDIYQEIKQIENEILTISLKYQFVTPLTSMVVTLPNQQKVEPCSCGAIPRAGQGLTNGPLPMPGAGDPFRPGQSNPPFDHSDIDKHLGSLPISGIPGLGLPKGLFAKTVGKTVVSDSPNTGANGGNVASDVNAPVVPPAPPVSPSLSATSTTPQFVITVTGLSDPLCFNLPLTSGKEYKLLDAARGSSGYVLDATIGKSLIEKLSVIRKIRRFSVPSTVTKSNVEDTEVYSYNEMVSGMIIKVISKADGLMIVIEVKNNRGNPSGILGILRDLQATVTAKSGNRSRLSITSGSQQIAATATEATYTANNKCLFIKETDIANLQIDVNSFLKP
ncbi:inter-alpha-trypsin inhibitor heavy chain H4 isoform X1 [Magallana gigas]|uniref:inter-alpha-trypsin inhibitor heavy chain H4 isoform X1 n=1 Tax=Magallana gigas TaxID=29159 RepID=UPI003341AEF0